MYGSKMGPALTQLPAARYSALIILPTFGLVISEPLMPSVEPARLLFQESRSNRTLYPNISSLKTATVPLLRRVKASSRTSHAPSSGPVSRQHLRPKSLKPKKSCTLEGAGIELKQSTKLGFNANSNTLKCPLLPVAAVAM